MSEQIGWPRLEVSDADMGGRVESPKRPSVKIGRLAGWLALVVIVVLLVVQCLQPAPAAAPKLQLADRNTVSADARYP